VWVATEARRERRRERKAERLEAAKAQAMLVVIDQIELFTNRPGFYVHVRNLSAEPVLDVEIASATFTRVPDAKSADMEYIPSILKVLRPDIDRRMVGSIGVYFIDDKGDSAITGSTEPGSGNFVADADPADLDVTIRFMDAHGYHWMRSFNTVDLLKRG
jgi:hypothetical protein